ncbi:hypothetical protein [Prosthecobacter sp.]|uniref:hypothetical protein n=1 Tax=Prosthecobacter sp. TaxID=1965333 RepID=UPI0037830ABF
MSPLPIIIGQELAPDWLGEARRQFEVSWHPHSYFESLRSVGALYVAANALMILSFFVAIFLTLRRTSPHLATFSVLAPVILGAAAMLVHILHLTHALGDDYWSRLSTGHPIHVDALKELRSIPFPLYLGAGLSAVSTLLLWLRNTKTSRQP